MQINQEKTDDKGRFYIEENNVVVAEMYYHFHNEKTFIITHTEVNELMEGKGIGKQLLVAAVEYARTNNFKIQATCPFAKKILDRSNEFADVYVTHKNI